MKKRKLIFLLPIAAMALGACGKKDDGGSSDPGEQEHEDEVTLAIKNKANFELEVEATKQLEAELKGTTGTLVWASSAEAVARVDQTGKVTAVAVGSATISVSFGDHVDSVVVTVKEKDVPPTPVSFEDAYKEAAKLSDNGSTSTAEAYTMIGIVVARQGNSFYMQNGDYTIEIYNQLINEAPAVIGKEVKAVTTLKNYYGNIESSEVTSLEYTGNDGEVKTTAVANKTALEAVRINNPIVPAKLTVVKVDSKYASRSSDGKLTVKIGEDTDSVTLIMSKNCVNDAAAAVLNNAQPGDVLTVSKGITAVFKSAYQISLSDDSVVTKEAAPQKELESISIEGSLAKASYEEGDAYSAEGLSVKAHYKDGTSGTVAATISFDKTTAALGDVSVTASVSYLGKEASQEFTVTVTEKVVHTAISYTFTNTDEKVLNIGNWTTEPSEEFMKHVVSDGGAVITGMSSPTNAYIGGNGGSTGQEWNIWNCLKVGKSKAKGSISLTLDPAATFSAIKMEVVGARDDGTLTVNGITKDVTKKATVDDLTPMTLEFAISENTGTLELSSKDAASNNYGICITKISFVDAVVPEPVPELSSIELTTGPSKTEYYAGEEFNAEGMVITAKYTHGGEDKVLQASEYTIDKTTLALEDEYVTVSYTEGEITKTVQVPVTVTKAPVPVTGITLNEEELSMHVLDADVQLVATVAPDDADDKTVAWTVSEDGVVTVENGLVHAVAPGEVVVTATAGDFSATCTVTVAAAEKVISGIEVTTPPTKTTYVEGETFNPEGMKITVTYSSAHEPEVMSSGFVCSTDPLVLDQTTVDVEYSGFHANASVTVTPAPVLDSITVANATGKTNAYSVGDVISKDDLVVTAHYTQGKQDAVVTDYTISKTTALAVGDTSATITYVEGGVEKTCAYSFTVAQANVIETMSAESLGLKSSYESFSVVSSETGVLFEGNAMVSNSGYIQMRDTAQGSGIYSRTSGRYLKSIAFEFDSANGKTISVYGLNGAYKDISSTTEGTLLGSVTSDGKITAEDNYLNFCIVSTGATYIKSITVEWSGAPVAKSVESVTLNKTAADVGLDSTLQLSAIVDGLGVSQNVLWETSDAAKATVENGLVTPVAGGEVTITAKSADDNSVKAECVVTVTAEKTLMATDFATTESRPSHSAYNDTWSFGDFTITNGANNQAGWDYIKLGKKSATQTCTVDAPAAPAEVKKVIVAIHAGSLSKSQMSVTEWGVEVFSDAEMTTSIDKVVSSTAITKNEAEVTFTPTAGKTWAEGCYIRVYFKTVDNNGGNGVVCLTGITYIG